MRSNKVALFPGRCLSVSGRTHQGGELTPREIEVLDLAHLTNKEIAYVLGCEYSTVRAHFRHLLSKLGVNNRTAAVKAYAGQLSERELRRAA